MSAQRRADSGPQSSQQSQYQATVSPVPTHAPPSAAQPPTSTEFRTVMGNFATGVTIITVVNDSVPAGFTCQTFTSLSLDPPLVSFAVSRESFSRRRILAAGRFCVNILAFDQRGLCSRFATRDVDRFEGVSWWHSSGGSPVLDGSLAWVDCTVEAEYPAGDHSIVIGRVRDLAYLREAAPLVYHRGGFANCFPAPDARTLPRVG